jgi:general secretion pathway protein B
MSLILEALKKSEAERRLGQPPGLLSPVIRPGKEPRRWGLWLVLGLLPALVAGAWWYGRSSVPAPVLVAVADAPAETAAPAAAPEPQTAVPSREVAAAPRPSQPAPARVDLPAQDPASATPARAAPSALRARLPPAEPAQEDPGERESLPIAPDLALPLPGALPPAARQVPPEPAPPPAALPAPVAQPAAPASIPSAAANDEPWLPTLRELDAGLRSELPPLRVTMHVYNADPERRFVLIDGRRYTEGSKLTAELELVEIRREGSVLGFRGRQFLLPR